MGDIVPIKTINAPALANAFGYQESDLTEGAGIGFAVLTYRGKVWRVVHKGKELALRTPEGDPIPSVRVVILKANPNLSKIYYKKSYQEGDNEAPDCFSMDGEKPDASIKNPQCKTCAACPQAAWGSKISDDGRELKACQDSRRLAVVPCNDIGNEGFGGPMLLRVPAASLGNLVAYDDMLKQANAAYFGVATKVSFDLDAAYPKLVFEYDAASTGKLSAEDGSKIVDMRSDERVKRILSTQSVQEHRAAGEVEAGAPPAPAKPVAEPPPAKAVKEVVEVPEEAVAQAPVEDKSPPAQEHSGEVVQPATEADVDALVQGLLSD